VDTHGPLGAREARVWRRAQGSGHGERWGMTRPRSAPSVGPRGSAPGLAGQAEGDAPADRGHPADRGCGRYRCAVASTPRPVVAPVGADRSAGPRGVDTGAGRVPCSAWPGNHQAACAGSRGGSQAAGSAAYTRAPPTSEAARDGRGADGETCSARGRRRPPGDEDGPARREGARVPRSRAPGLARRPTAARPPPPWPSRWARRGVQSAGASSGAAPWVQSPAPVWEAWCQATRHVARKTVRTACPGQRTRGGVGTQRGPSSAHAPAGPRQWRGKGAWRVWSQGGRTLVAPRGPPRLCWPHGRSVWRTARNSRGRRRRVVPTRRAWRACGTGNTVGKEGVGSHAARRAAPHGACVPVGQVGPGRCRQARAASRAQPHGGHRAACPPRGAVRQAMRASMTCCWAGATAWVSREVGPERRKTAATSPRGRSCHGWLAPAWAPRPAGRIAARRGRPGQTCRTAQQIQRAVDRGEGRSGAGQLPGGRLDGPVAEQALESAQIHPGFQPRRGTTLSPRLEACAVGDPSDPRGVGGDLWRGGAGQGRGAVLPRQEPRRGAGAWPGGAPCGQETGRQQGGAVLRSCALRDADQPPVTCESSALQAHAFPDAPASGRGGHAPYPVPGVGRTAAQALACCDPHQVRQRESSRTWGAGEGTHIPAEGRARAARASTGHLVTGTPCQAAFDASMGQGRTPLVRAEGVGCSAVARGQACDGSDRGVLGPGGAPLQRHSADHRGASWGQRVAPVSARGIRTETPPAGASTEPLYGSGEDNHTRAVRWKAHHPCHPGMGRETPSREGTKRGKTAAQRLSATIYCAAPSGLRDHKAPKDRYRCSGLLLES